MYHDLKYLQATKKNSDREAEGVIFPRNAKKGVVMWLGFIKKAGCQLEQES